MKDTARDSNPLVTLGLRGGNGRGLSRKGAKTGSESQSAKAPRVLYLASWRLCARSPLRQPRELARWVKFPEKYASFWSFWSSLGGEGGSGRESLAQRRKGAKNRLRISKRQSTKVSLLGVLASLREIPLRQPRELAEGVRFPEKYASFWSFWSSLGDGAGHEVRILGLEDAITTPALGALSYREAELGTSPQGQKFRCSMCPTCRPP
jgi:hypothetical protein